MNDISPLSNKKTELIVKFLWFAPIFIMVVLVAACSQISNQVYDERISEGTIEYSISFPELGDESITATLMPETMIYAFKENAFASHFEAAGGMFKNRVIADKNAKTVEHQLKVFRKKIKVIIQETEVLQMLANYPKMTVIKTEDIDTIAGFRCEKALIVFEDVSMSEIEVFYTKDIKMDNPNWCTQYHEINGVLLAYDIEEFGIRMRLVAKSVKQESISPEELLPQNDYTPISKESMDVELAQLVETFEL